MMVLSKPQRLAKFEVAGFIYFGNIMEFVFLFDIFAFKPPFGGVRGNVRTSSIARWRAVVNFLFAIVQLFSLALTVETL